MKRTANIVIVLTLLTMGTDAIADRSKPFPEPGYHCFYEDRGLDGLISSRFDVAASGKVRGAYIRWESEGNSIAAPRLGGAWFRLPDGQFSTDYGYVTAFWHIWDREHGTKPQPLTLSLELTTTVGPTMKSSRMASDPERSGGPFHLSVPWSDASAMAKGAEKLFIVARDVKFEIVRSAELDRSIFERFKPRLKSAFNNVRNMIADPAKNCTFTNDIHDQDIIVT